MEYFSRLCEINKGIYVNVLDIKKATRADDLPPETEDISRTIPVSAPLRVGRGVRLRTFEHVSECLRATNESEMRVDVSDIVVELIDRGLWRFEGEHPRKIERKHTLENGLILRVASREVFLDQRRNIRHTYVVTRSKNCLQVIATDVVGSMEQSLLHWCAQRYAMIRPLRPVLIATRALVTLHAPSTAHNHTTHLFERLDCLELIIIFNELTNNIVISIFICNVIL